MGNKTSDFYYLLKHHFHVVFIYLEYLWGVQYFCNATKLISLFSRFRAVLEFDGIPQFWNTAVPRVLEWRGVPCPIWAD